MHIKLATSLLGLALIATPLAAQSTDQKSASGQVIAQPQMPQEVLALLADKRPAAELSVEELKARFKAARQFAKDESLPADMRGELKTLADASRAELEVRAQAQQPAAPKPQAQAVAPPVVAPPPAPKQQAQAEAPQAVAPAAPAAKPAEPVAPAQLPQAVLAVLNDQRPAAELTTEELKKRIQIAHHFARDPNLPPDVVAQLKAINETAAVDLQTRMQAQTAKDQAATDQAAADQAAKAQAAADLAAKKKAAADKAAAGQAAKDQAAADQAAKAQAAADLAAKKKAAADQAAAQAAAAQAAQDQAGANPPVKDASGQIVPNVAVAKPVQPLQPDAKPIEKPVAVVAPPPPAVQVPTPENVQKLDANVGDPAAEQAAKTYLANKDDISKLGDEQLRTRLDNARELLAANELSLETERAVRAKLKQEREVLRTRLAQAEAAKQAQALNQATVPPDKPLIARPVLPTQPGTPTAPPPRPQNNSGLDVNVSINLITDLTPARIVLSDRRPPEQLQVTELQRRIRVYEDAQADDNYAADQRDYWRQSVGYDRELLRQRMKQERHRREAALAMAAAQNEIDVQIQPYGQAAPRPPRAVFAAEVDDADMMDVLTSSAGNGQQQRYKIKDIANQQAIRNSVSRIEVDTLRFGYNEGFIREEQLGSLDAIAAIIEKIVKKYPQEVFLIEGHTDAVGSDAYNLKLSKLRAESVKKALTTYYVIPAKNLRTVGLGERFLKIPTADPEPENRRVSIARITSLLSSGQ